MWLSGFMWLSDFMWLNGFMWLKVVKDGENWGGVGKSGKKLLVYLQQHMLVNQQQHVVLEVYRHTQHKIPPTRHTIGVSCM